MWLHIRGVGQWTNRVHDYFEREQEKLHSGQINPLSSACTSPEKKRVSNGSITSNNNQNPLKKIHQTLSRKFSNKSQETKDNPKLVGYANEGFSKEGADVSLNGEGDVSAACSKAGELTFRFFLIRTQSKFDCFSESEGATPNFRLTRLLVPGSKTPLEKSLSMPDMQNKTKKRERLMA